MHALPVLVLLAATGPGSPPRSGGTQEVLRRQGRRRLLQARGPPQARRGRARATPRRPPIFLKKACELNLAPACLDYAAAWRSGEGVKRDPLKAVPLYQKACDGSVAEACAQLAGMFAAGKEVEKHLGHAAELYGRACDGGHRRLLRPARRDVRRGLADAEATWRRRPPSTTRAARAGDATSCGRLAAMLRDGRGVPRDMAKAAALARKSCDGGADGGLRRPRARAPERRGSARRPEAGARALHQGLRRRRRARLPGPRRAGARRRRRGARPAAGARAVPEGLRRRRSAPAATSGRCCSRAGRGRRPTWPRRPRCCARPARTATRAAASRSASCSRPAAGSCAT